MTTRTTAIWAVLAGVGLVGCMGSGGEGATMSALGACPDDLGGARCDADSVCAVPGTDDVCRCVYGSDGMEGHYECGPAPSPGFCDESVRTGVVCDPSIATECVRGCDAAVTCRCVPAADTAGCSHVWLCEDVSVPPGGGDHCTPESLERCIREGMGICIGESGEECRCYVGTDGEAHVECSINPPTDPGTCTEEDYRACEAGIYVECRGPDGTTCRCSSGTDGDPSGGGLICDGPPPPPPTTRYCTDEDVRACASGMTGSDLLCIDERGWTCRCAGPDRDPAGGLICEPPPPPPSTEPACDDVALERCLRGEEIRCVMADGLVCWCDPSSTTGFVCG